MTKQKWKKIKKDLPKNWAQEVSKSLTSAGFIITPGKVSDIKRGKIKDTIIVSAVFKEIKKLGSRQRRKRSGLKKLL